ncbi:MAG TPA: hypothetical protein VHW72_18375 [Candidatus Angelobacter sp.]|jgi:hypothetical protein|nr:hypothetical protein [Candidatus Angelobacter sp.]
MSAAPYISKLTGDLVIEETVKERREADARWVRRHKRSLGRNKQFRACVRADHELRAELAKMRKHAEKSHASDATSVYQRFKDFLGLTPRMFARRSATS